MVQRLGGVLTHMEDIWFYVYAIPDHRDLRNRRGLVVRGIPDAVWVNMQGSGSTMRTSRAGLGQPRSHGAGASGMLVHY